MHFMHHRISCLPRKWQQVAESLSENFNNTFQPNAALLYGVWRSQIGRPRDELNVISVWGSGETDCEDVNTWFDHHENIVSHASRNMTPTLRPTHSTPPTRQGNYAFRLFETPEGNWDEFLELCAGAWPGFEAAYDSQVIGLWELASAKSGIRESLLLTRRPNLAMWERSKQPANADEAEVRRKLSRRYDLCDATEVFTTTLLTATDAADETRWT